MPEGRSGAPPGVPGTPDIPESSSLPVKTCTMLNAVISSVLLVTFKFKIVFFWVVF